MTLQGISILMGKKIPGPRWGKGKQNKWLEEVWQVLNQTQGECFTSWKSVERDNSSSLHVFKTRLDAFWENKPQIYIYIYHRMVGVGRYLKSHLVPPCHGTPSTRPGCPQPHPAWPRTLQEWRNTVWIKELVSCPTRNKTVSPRGSILDVRI